MATFITALDPGPGPGPLLAVKDLIDVAGVATTAGSRVVARSAAPAGHDAPCLAGARAAGARLVGKANLYELAFGASGVNEWYGTPVNPLDAGLVPGGSSSGSAVAVAEGAADVAYGSDTGGSIRVPSAFCGTVGLKTTFGRVPVAGVWPLAPSLDTVGPMGRDVAAVVLGMALLEPGFTPAPAPPPLVARLRPAGPDGLLAVDPVIDAAVDRALAAAGIEIAEVVVGDWEAAYGATTVILESEAAASNRALLDDRTCRAGLGATVRRRLEAGAAVEADRVAAARGFRGRWQETVAGLFGRAPVLALPTVPFFPPPLGEADGHRYTTFTNPFNLAGVPALSLPVPTTGPLPAGLQLVAPAGGEELLLATAAVIEAAVGPPR
ncbi:MAG TPA: amidase [Acidimicrobiales bacterium]|nr:amidase [Acidimicrobiales bacterium]